MSILSLQNEFLARDSALQFWIGCSARLTVRVERETGLDETLEEWMRLVRLALKFRGRACRDQTRCCSLFESHKRLEQIRSSRPAYRDKARDRGSHARARNAPL